MEKHSYVKAEKENLARKKNLVYCSYYPFSCMFSMRKQYIAKSHFLERMWLCSGFDLHLDQLHKSVQLSVMPQSSVGGSLREYRWPCCYCVGRMTWFLSRRQYTALLVNQECLLGHGGVCNKCVQLFWVIAYTCHEESITVLDLTGWWDGNLTNLRTQIKKKRNFLLKNPVNKQPEQHSSWDAACTSL